MKELKKAIINEIAAAERRLQTEEAARQIAGRLGVPRVKVKQAMNELVLEGKLEFTYYGRSFVELPLTMSRLPRSSDSAEPNSSS